MARSLLALACFVVGCAHGPAATETLPKLKDAIESEVATPEQNAENGALVEQVSDRKQLHGLTRAEVRDQLGQGDPCSRHPLCAERGFDPNDWYYEVGRDSAAYTVRYRPALIVGFSRFGKVDRTFVLRAQKD